MDKKFYSDKLNTWFGFKGSDAVDFTKMKEVDLIMLYAKTSAVDAAKEEVGDGDNSGIFGFGILRGGVIKKILGTDSKKEAIIKRVLDSLDADDAKKLEERFGPLAKIAMALLGDFA